MIPKKEKLEHVRWAVQSHGNITSLHERNEAAWPE